MPKLKTKSGAKKRFKITGYRQGALCPARQAPRHDQADQQADPQPARHQRAVQERRRQYHQVFPAERLNARSPSLLVHLRCRRVPSWHASSAASHRTPSTRKIFEAAKGFYGRRKNTIRAAKAAVDRSMQYAYRDRKNSKRTFRALWIQRLNAAVREMRPYLQPLHRRPCEAGIEVDRKVLSELAIHEPAAFRSIVEKAKAALPAPAA